MSMVLVLNDLKAIIERQLLSLKHGKTAWTFGYRIHPITKKPQLHNGVDLPAPEGTEVHAPFAGRVLNAWFDKESGGGNSVILSHDGPIARTGYAHMQKFVVTPGQDVAAGDIIGYVDSTGSSTGNHLHFVIRKLINGELQCVDPLPDLCVAAGVVELPEEHPVG